MTTGQKIETQLDNLDSIREDLVDNLEIKGITGLSGDEKFDELVPKVLDITGPRFTPTNIKFNHYGTVDDPVSLSNFDTNSTLDLSNVKDASYMFSDSGFKYLTFKSNSEFKPESISHFFENSCVYSPNSGGTADKYYGQGYFTLDGINLSQCKDFSYLLNGSKRYLRTQSGSGPSSSRGNFYFPSLSDYSKIENINNIFATSTPMSILSFPFGQLTNLVTADNLFGYSYSSFEMDINIENKSYSKLKSISHIFTVYSTIKQINVSNVSLPVLSKISYLCNTNEKSNITSNLTLSNITIGTRCDVGNAFYQLSSMQNLDLSTVKFTNGISSAQYAFYYCSSLKTLKLPQISSITGSLSNMFLGCTALESVDLSKITSSNATTYLGMFSGCSKLTTLDLSKFNIYNNQVSVASMFYGCTSLQHIDIRKMQLSKITSSSYYSNMLNNVPTNCEIIVKDATEKSWVNTKFPTYTNVKTVSEYEAEQNS